MAKAKVKDTKDKEGAPTYGVPHFAEELGVTEGTVRRLLRDSELTKEGRYWGTSSKTEAAKMVKALKTAQKESDEAKSAKSTPKAKPAKSTPKGRKPRKAKAEAADA